MRHTLVFMLLMVFPVFGMAGTIHVPGDQPTIQAGIDAAVDGDTVLVADGTYTGEGNRDIDFLGKAITVRSENGAENCSIDCEGSEADPHRGFFFHSSEGLDSVLQGFTIRNGSRMGEDGYYNCCGGGIYCGDSSPTIIQNTIVENEARFGGGIYCHNGSSPAINFNSIANNLALGSQEAPGGEGGGIYCRNASPTITNCTFSDNEAFLYSYLVNSGSGGGIFCLECSLSITNCTFIDNSAVTGGGIHGEFFSASITNCTFSLNAAYSGGGGVSCEYSSPTITNCTFSENKTNGSGGGIACYSSSPTITTCTFSENKARSIYNLGRGGGISCTNSSPMITNCTFRTNRASKGGGISGGSPIITNCTFRGNVAVYEGGGIYCYSSSSPMITNCIVWHNFPDEIYVYSGSPTVSYSDVQGGWPGEGNIDADPLFVTGPVGDCYLGDDSPCVDAGDPTTEPYGTTGSFLDTGIVDMGYHYPARGLVVGPGPAPDNPPTVRVFPPEQDAEFAFEFSAYGPTHYGVNVTCGDMTGNGMVEILTGAGPGEIYGPHVRGFEPDGMPLPGLSFFAYGTNKYGVNLAAGDLDGDSYDEIITGAGQGAVFGPHVRGWDYDGSGTVTPIPGVSFFAYGTPKWGVNVACGDIDGDGYDEIVTGAGSGAVYGPHVRGWDYDGVPPVTPVPGCSFFAYGTNKYGVNVSCGDVDGDGIDEIITAPGPGAMFGTHIRGWNYDGFYVEPLAGFSFFAWDDYRFGAKVFAGDDLNGSGRDETVVGCGPDPAAGTPVKVFLYDGAVVTEWLSLDAFGDLGLTRGTTLAAGRF